MDVTLTTDAEAFARAAEPYLERAGVRANLVASILSRSRAGVLPFETEWILVRDASGDVTAAAMASQGYPPYVPPMPEQAAQAVAGALARRGTLIGVNGDGDAARIFAAEFVRISGGRAHQVMAQGLYVLGTLRPPRAVAGRGRIAAGEDADVCFAWALAFRAEVMHDEPAPDPASFTARVGRGAVVVWEAPDGRPVSMAGHNGPDLGVARIGPVYTPPEQRRRGYAAAVTAEAARRLREAGAEHVILFTDLANPTSNGVYTRIGFERVGEAAMWRFSPQ